jgi:hypothetical protein
LFSSDSATWLSTSTAKVTVCLPGTSNVQSNWLLPSMTRVRTPRQFAGLAAAADRSIHLAANGEGNVCV